MQLNCWFVRACSLCNCESVPRLSVTHAVRPPTDRSVSWQLVSRCHRELVWWVVRLTVRLVLMASAVDVIDRCCVRPTGGTRGGKRGTIVQKPRPRTNEEYGRQRSDPLPGLVIGMREMTVVRSDNAGGRLFGDPDGKAPMWTLDGRWFIVYVALTASNIVCSNSVQFAASSK